MLVFNLISVACSLSLSVQCQFSKNACLAVSTSPNHRLTLITGNRKYSDMKSLNLQTASHTPLRNTIVYCSFKLKYAFFGRVLLVLQISVLLSYHVRYIVLLN